MKNLAIVLIIIYFFAAVAKINAQVDQPKDLNQHINLRLSEMFNSALNFYKEKYPALYNVIPTGIKIQLAEKIKHNLMMEADYNNKSINISLSRVRKWLIVSKQETDQRIIQYADIYLKSVLVHELAHHIHYNAYKKLQDEKRIELINTDLNNEDFREFLASMMESIYLIHEKGLSWFYQHHAAFFLLNFGLPPLSEKYIGDRSEISFLRRWSVFDILIHQTGCWEKDIWNKEKLKTCFENNNNNFLKENIKQWLLASFDSSEFIPYHNKDLKEVLIKSEKKLITVINEAYVVIQSKIYNTFPLFNIDEQLKGSNLDFSKIDTGEISKLIDGWYIFRLHHLGGLFPEEKVKSYVLNLNEVP